MSHYSMRILAFSLFIVCTIAFCRSPVFAEDCAAESRKDAAGVMVADITLARPIGTVATVAGFAIFVVAAPFSALGGNTKEAWESLVVAPAAYTFKRPLGDIDCRQPPSEKQK